MPERAAAALQLQAARVLPVVCGPADGPDGGPSGRVCHPLGADPPMGRLGAHPLAALDGAPPPPPSCPLSPPLGPAPTMGRLGAHPLAVLDGGVPGPHGAGPYDHPYH